MKLDKNPQRSLLLGLILSCVTGILIFIVGGDETISDFDQGLTFIIGLTTMGALSAFHQYKEDRIICDRLDQSIEKNQEIETSKEERIKID